MVERVRVKRLRSLPNYGNVEIEIEKEVAGIATSEIVKELALESLKAVYVR